MKSFVLATANAHKAAEMTAVLSSLGIETLDRPIDAPEVDETEMTLVGNALLKAEALVKATGQSAIADDTGLFVGALHGRPGVHSARYAGESASDHDNVEKLLAELADVHEGHRGAEFRTVIAIAHPDGSTLCVEGVLQGSIAMSPSGSGGFGYDPVFIVEDDGRTLSELSPEEKNVVSHRARALHALADALRIE